MASAVESLGKAPAQLGGRETLPAAWWAVARMSLEAELRSVSGVLELGGDGGGGGDAGDDLEGDVGLAEGGDLLGGAAEDEGVAGLEAEDGGAGVAVAGAGVLEHEGVDAGLGDAGLAAALADGDDEGGGAGEVEDLVGDEVVGEDDVGGLEELEGAQGEQAGISGACADEIDGSGLGFSLQEWGLGSVRGGGRGGIGAGVLAGEDAGGALVEAADLALGELVEEELALVVEGLGGDDLAAEIAEVGEPVAGVEGELGVDLLAELLGEGGAGAGGGDGDLEVAAADDGGEVEVAEGWVVDGVAEDVGGDGLVVDGAVDGGVVGGGDDEEVVGFGIGHVAGGVGALLVVDFAGGGEVQNALAGVRGDDGDVGVGGAEGVDLGLGQVAGTDDEAAAAGELEEDGEEIHAVSSFAS